MDQKIIGETLQDLGPQVRGVAPLGPVHGIIEGRSNCKLRSLNLLTPMPTKAFVFSRMGHWSLCTVCCSWAAVNPTLSRPQSPMFPPHGSAQSLKTT